MGQCINEMQWQKERLWSETSYGFTRIGGLGINALVTPSALMRFTGFLPTSGWSYRVGVARVGYSRGSILLLIGPCNTIVLGKCLKWVQQKILVRLLTPFVNLVKLLLNYNFLLSCRSILLVHVYELFFSLSYLCTNLKH